MKEKSYKYKNMSMIKVHASEKEKAKTLAPIPAQELSTISQKVFTF